MLWNIWCVAVHFILILYILGLFCQDCATVAALKQKLGFIKQVDKGSIIYTVKDSEARVSSISPSSEQMRHFSLCFEFLSCVWGSFTFWQLEFTYWPLIVLIYKRRLQLFFNCRVFEPCNDYSGRPCKVQFSQKNVLHTYFDQSDNK